MHTDCPLAHHCKKNHPYSTIIRDYYLKAATPRPRLFSMTASPVDSRKDIDKTIRDLEELLHSKVVTTSDSSLLMFAHKPRDEAWIYGRRGLEVDTQLFRTLLPARSLIPELEPAFKAAWTASADLGTWFADRILAYELGSPSNSADGLDRKFERGKVFTSMPAFGGNADTQNDAMKKLKELSSLAEDSKLGPLSWKTADMSSKVQILFQKLSLWYADQPNTKAMVFVNQRFTAVLLCDGLRALGLPSIRPAYLTGSGRSGREVVTGKRQEKVMRDFHSGNINLLFTTSVGEEGIDVPQCNLVIRFDLYTTVIQYMQSRGRARMKDSVFAHMIEEDNFQHKSDMDWVIDSAKYLKDYCLRLPADRLLGRGTKLAQIIARDSANCSFQTSTGAVCNFNNCLGILSRYASSLHHSGAMTRELYEERISDNGAAQFQYIVRLPITEQSKVKGTTGDPRQNKASAKRSAAFKCVARLRAQGLLDDDLNSIFHEMKPHNLNARLAVSKKQDAYGMKIKPDFWQLGLGEVPNILFAAKLMISSSTDISIDLAPMVLLTRQPLPDFPKFPIHLDDGVQGSVSLTNHGTSYTINQADLALLTSYTMNAVFADVFNKVYKDETSQVGYWLAPIASHTINGSGKLLDFLDFDALSAACGERRKWVPGTPSSEWCNKFLVDPFNGKYHYFTEGIVDKAKAFDPEPIEYVPQKGKKRQATSILAFTDSHWSAKQKDWLATQWDPEQPVLVAEVQTVRRNYLDAPTEKEMVKQMCWLAPEPLQMSRISPDMARTVLAWPSIVHRLESYLIAQEAFGKMGLENVPLDLALEAFTKDDNTDDQDEQVHVGKCRGMGKNYERLEFIGDSLLKMTTTITVFNRTTCDEEGMHCRRMEILCNLRLYTVATESLGLEQHIRSKGFTRDTWYPENLILLQGRGAKGEPVKHPPGSHSLGMKTIADVCEASIGAAVMATKHLNIPKRFELGIQAITRLVESDDHDVSSWDDFKTMYRPQSWEHEVNDPIAQNLAREVSKRIGYEFKYPRLIRSAFTHSSDMDSPVPDLQRLEFLGDAVLDWVCIWWLFDNNPDKNPQWLTEHKMAMVSNMFLAALAITLDFDKLVALRTSKLAAAIFDYAGKVRAELAKPDCKPNFWMHLGELKPPKALSDLVESTLGAILIDSEFDYTKIEAFFERHVKPFFEDISLYDGFASMQPTSHIHKKLTREYGCCRFTTRSSEQQSGPLDITVLAGLLVHGTVLASSSGQSKKYAMARASKKALDLLEGMSIEEFRRQFGCDCTKGAELGVIQATDLQSGLEAVTTTTSTP